MSEIQAVRGMNDILPDQTFIWQQVERQVQQWLAAYGYDEIRMPLLESTRLFSRSVGEVTDIVEKEMYTFVDRNGDSLTLRPEGTAQCVRACLEHGLLHQASQRLWYMGPMFRHERPQKGRYRQFFQVGVEAFGMEGPEIESEHLEMVSRLWQQLGIASQMRLEINTLGGLASRQQYKSALIDYFSQQRTHLDEDSVRRLEKNPLRILDSKNPEMADLIAAAPKMSDYIDEASQQHFRNFCRYLESLKIEYTINPRLVRGLDYYSRTVYEWVTDQLGAQGTVCGGGRYDGLVAELGGRSTPAVGFSIGVERLLALWIQAQERSVPVLDAYLIVLGEPATAAAFLWAQHWRTQAPTLRLKMHLSGGSLKSQLKAADKSGARFALIVGEEELAQERVCLKALREEGQQSLHPWQTVIEQLIQ